MYKLLHMYQYNTDETGMFTWHGKELVSDDVLNWAENEIDRLRQELSNQSVVRLNVQSYGDRERLVPSIANAGYPVWIEETPKGSNTIYHVCFLYHKQESNNHGEEMYQTIFFKDELPIGKRK